MKYSGQIESLVDLSTNFERSTKFLSCLNSAISEFSFYLCVKSHKTLFWQVKSPTEHHWANQSDHFMPLLHFVNINWPRSQGKVSILWINGQKSCFSVRKNALFSASFGDFEMLMS